MPRITELKPRVAMLQPRIARAINSDSWRAGKTTAERGYGSRWQKARERHLAANPLCVMCLADGRVAAASVVDHRTPHQGDSGLFWDRRNWDSLCAPCHNSAKQRIENAQKSQRSATLKR